MELIVNNPNLSLIMPVGCNAKCQFCYWQKRDGLTVDRFQFICNTLPPIFKQISITGGEPTISKDLVKYLKIARKRFEKVVLNTNGFKLTKEHFKYIDHVNISRHHWNDSDNQEVFRTNNIPNLSELKKLCTYGDVTLNCVLPDKFSDKKFIEEYINFAKHNKAKVAFRKYFNNLNILPVDNDDTLIGEHSCPACLHRWHKINGVDVTYKYSVKETFEAANGIYELIIQSNGDLTFDWQGNNKLNYKEV